jgi:hypothetical protein
MPIHIYIYIHTHVLYLTIYIIWRQSVLTFHDVLPEDVLDKMAGSHVNMAPHVSQIPVEHARGMRPSFLFMHVCVCACLCVCVYIYIYYLCACVCLKG